MSLKIKFVPYEFLSQKRSGIFDDLKKDTIIIIDAKLSPEEEAKIIKQTMKRVTSKFTGVELSSLDLAGIEKHPVEKAWDILLEFIIGKKRGITVIGPARVIRKIERDPKNLLLLVS